MNIKDMIKDILLKESELTDDEIKKIFSEIKKDNILNRYEPIYEIKLIQDKYSKYADEIISKAKSAKQELNILDMPQECVNIHAYYFYLIKLLRELYPLRNNFFVIKALYLIIHTITDQWDIIKKGLIETEFLRIKSYGHTKDSFALKSAIEQINKIKFQNFVDKVDTIDFLYNKALKENKNY